MKKAFTASNYGWNVDGLVHCINDNKLKSKILFANAYGAIVHVVSYAESEILGAESAWCISQHKVSWEQYVEKTNGTQLFFYCFKHSVKGDNSLYGATFQVKGDIVSTYCCFTRENHPIAKALGFKTDEEAILTVVRKEFGEDVLNELGDAIYNINMDKKEAAKPVAKKEVVKKKEKAFIPTPAEFFSPYDYDPFFDDDFYHLVK